MYNSIGLKTGQIYIVGKASKKQHANAQVIQLMLIYEYIFFFTMIGFTAASKKGKLIDLSACGCMFWGKTFFFTKECTLKFYTGSHNL